MVEVPLTNEQKVRFTASPTTASGSPASLDGNLGAVVDSGDATVEPGAGSLDVVVRPGPGFLGDVTGRIQGDADLGAGVETIEETFTLHVTSARAANLGVVATVEPA